MSVPTPTGLRALLLTLVAGVAETHKGCWETLVGEVEMLPLAFHSRCNWRIHLDGVEDERKVLDAAVELLKREPPYVSQENPGG